MFDNPCNKGFYCKAQTGESTKTRDNCPQTYYCPPGTGIYDYTSNTTDYSNWENDAPTRCPRGTGNDKQDTKQNLLQCGINDEFKLMRPNVNTDRSGYLPQGAQTERLLKSTSAKLPEETEEVRMRNL
jgi:hypothetical protein